MLEAVLIDLDNTLIIFDEIAFYDRYFRRLYPWFENLFSRNEFLERLVDATLNMEKNNGDASNLDFFLGSFSAGREKEREEFWRRFERFYREEFGTVSVDVTPAGNLQTVLQELRCRNLKMVLASNPLYPEAAMATRLSWGGVDRGMFDLVTHIENMSFVKPRLGYYRQVCEKIDVPPGQCLMVGNDPVNDMVASLAGMKTYRTIEAAEIDYGKLTKAGAESRLRESRQIPEPDFHGPLSGVLEVVRDLQKAD